MSTPKRRPSMPLGWRMRRQAGDQAGDLAGADIERGDQRAALGRYRLHLGGEAVVEGVHALPPFGFGFLALSASSRAWAAASDRRSVTRSGKRRSMETISRERIFLSRSSPTS